MGRSVPMSRGSTTYSWDWKAVLAEKSYSPMSSLGMTHRLPWLGLSTRIIGLRLGAAGEPTVMRAVVAPS